MRRLRTPHCMYAPLLCSNTFDQGVGSAPYASTRDGGLHGLEGDSMEQADRQDKGWQHGLEGATFLGKKPRWH